jgi:hypothetical protein
LRATAEEETLSKTSSVWRVTVRLAVKGTGAFAREVVLEGLLGSTRVEEVLRRGAEALGVGSRAPAAARCRGRLLRGGDTLEEAGVGADGAVEVWAGIAGGMPSGAEAAVCGNEELAEAVGQLGRDASGITKACAGPDSAPWEPRVRSAPRECRFLLLLTSATGIWCDALLCAGKGCGCDGAGEGAARLGRPGGTRRGLGNWGVDRRAGLGGILGRDIHPCNGL